MKKTILLISVLTLTFTTQIVNAQLINPGFETWSNDLLVPTAMQPNSGNATYGWWDYNFFNSSLIGSSPISVIRTTDTVRTGTYSVRLETKVYTPTSWNIYKTWGIPFIGHEYNDTLGILYNGNSDVPNQTYKPGIPFTQSITKFKFYYQYKPNGNDTAECRVSLMNSGTTVAGGIFKTNVATGNSGWQQAVINLTYVSGLTPDTLFVLFSSSSLDGNPKAGSVLWIDDVSTSLSTGIKQMLEEKTTMVIYPNPFSDATTIKFNNTTGEPLRLDVFDFTGKLVRSITNITDNQVLFNKKGLTNGIYLIQLHNNFGLTTSQKIIIK